MAGGPFYFNIRTGEVEEGPRDAMHVRMGPYATRGEAARAFELAAARTARLEEAEQDEKDVEDEWGVPPV